MRGVVVRMQVAAKADNKFEVWHVDHRQQMSAAQQFCEQCDLLVATIESLDAVEANSGIP